MNTRANNSSQPDESAPPISHAGELESESSDSEPTFGKYADLLKKSLEPAAGDWSHKDLAEMLLREATFQPDAADGKAAVAQHRQTQARAKRAIAGKVEGVDPDFARGIYYITLCRAWLEHGVWITSLQHAEVAEGLSYVQRLPWAKSHPVLSDKLVGLTRGFAARQHPPA